MKFRPVLIIVMFMALSVFSSQAFALFDSNVDKAKDFMKAGMYPQAVNILEKEISEKPTNAEAHFQLGICYINQGKTHSADQRFSSAVKIKSDYGYKIGEEYKKGSDVALKNGILKTAETLFVKAIEFSPEYKKDSFNFYKRLGDLTGDSDSKVDYYYKASGFTGDVKVKEKLGLKIVKVAASAWPGKKSREFQKVAAKLIGQEQVSEIFPGETTVVVFEKTYTTADNNNDGNIEILNLLKHDIKMGDKIEIFAKRNDGEKIIPENMWVAYNSDWNAKGGYAKVWWGKSTKSCNISIDDFIVANVKVTRKVPPKPNHALISKLLQ